MTDSPSKDIVKTPERIIARFCAWGSAAIGLLLIVIYWIQPDRLVAVTMVPPWLWFVSFLIGCFLVRHRALYYALAVWIIFACLHVDETKSFARLLLSKKVPSNTTIRVASLNCNIGNNSAANELLATDSDIYLIQESPSKADLKSLGFGNSRIPLDFVWNLDTSIGCARYYRIQARR